MQHPSAIQPDSARREPLWDRVDRNRVRLAVYVVVFVVCTVVVFDGAFVVIGGSVWLVSQLRAGAPPDWGAFESVLISLSALFALAAAAWAMLAILHAERWLLRKLDATLVPMGELLDTKMALKDMSLAAGLPVAPALWVLDSRNVNAFAFAAVNRRPVVGVTRGLVERLSVDEQRAVFANLVARIVTGDTMVATGVTALLWPLHAWREYQLESQNRALNDVLLAADRTPQSTEVPPFVLLLFPLALVGEIIAFGYRAKQLKAAEKADAEGMLLLKDPEPMLGALEKCVRFDNVVPLAGETFADLFYCWTGDSTNDAADPEWRRVARLREVLGVFGMAGASDQL